MHPKKAFKFCPKCGGQLIPQKENSLECVFCHFHLYINPLPTNGVIIENKKGEILLVKRAFPPKKGWWDVPGGFIKPHESIEQSIKREIKEELGVDIVIGKIIGIYQDTYLYEGVFGATLCIMVSGMLKNYDIHPADDVEDFAFFTKKEVLKQRIAFEGVKKGLSDYLSATSFPNLTA